ncbi:MAG: hypothetical protein GX144_05310 [Clostridiaceae bacterium]|jgi:hypothetical protein|nr:hypothetical protein [Clostridiaceae bacterium]
MTTWKDCSGSLIFIDIAGLQGIGVGVIVPSHILSAGLLATPLAGIMRRLSERKSNQYPI